MQIGEILHEHHAIIIAGLDRVTQAGRIDIVERVHQYAFLVGERVILCHNLVNAVKICLHGITAMRQCGKADILWLLLKEPLYKFGIAACYDDQ